MLDCEQWVVGGGWEVVKLTTTRFESSSIYLRSVKGTAAGDGVSNFALDASSIWAKPLLISLSDLRRAVSSFDFDNFISISSGRGGGAGTLVRISFRYMRRHLTSLQHSASSASRRVGTLYRVSNSANALA
jgi:hypothetical protein